MATSQHDHEVTDYTSLDVIENPCHTSKVNLNDTYTLGWKDISYTVEQKSCTGKSISSKKILQNVYGRSEPGEMTAIMGPSGSGKTTLLDVIGDRLCSGTIDGEILVNGTPREEKTFRAIASYVAQEDSLMGSFTTLETLRFSASLSLPSDVSQKEKEERVQAAIDDMGLRVCEHTIVGDIFRKGLSGGQKRRLSIAIELLSRPSILLLDEPTSGLDSSSTYNVMKYIVSIAKAGRTVLFTIHQPSSVVYNMFDNVMYLVAGETVFYGPREDAMTYFSSLGHACPQYSNPAEHFLSLINTDFEGHADVPAFVQAYKQGPVLKKMIKAIEGDAGRGGVDACVAESHLPGALSQFFTLFYRNSLNNIRNPGIYWVRLLMYIMLSFMVGTMYLYTNDDISDEDYVPLLFYVQAFLVFMSVAVLPFFIEERAVFLRERTNNSLNVGSYALANFLAVLPGIFLIAIISTVLVVLLADLNSFGWFLLNLFLSLVVAESLMHVIGAAVPHYIIGIALGAGIFGMFMLCEGFMVPRESIPGYWIWGYYIAFHTYSFESFIYEQFKNEPVGSVGHTILVRLGMENADVAQNMVILAIYAIVLQLIFAGILYKYHTGRR